jgi:hypothetical protein
LRLSNGAAAKVHLPDRRVVEIGREPVSFVWDKAQPDGEIGRDVWIKVPDECGKGRTSAEFEVQGWDVVIQASVNNDFEVWYTKHYEQKDDCKVWDRQSTGYPDKVLLMVECKPVISDGYPAVLRQVKRYPDSAWALKRSFATSARVVFAREVRSSAVSLGQIREIFAASGIALVLEHELGMDTEQVAAE